MGVEEDMFEYGFSDANDYVGYLMDQAESEFERMQAQEEEQDRYEAWLSSLTTEEREELEQEKKRKQEIERLRARQEYAKKDELERWFVTNNSIDNQIVRYDLYVRHLMGEYKDYEYWKNWLAKKEKFLQWKKENAQLWDEYKSQTITSIQKEALQTALADFCRLTLALPTNNNNELLLFYQWITKVEKAYLKDEDYYSENYYKHVSMGIYGKLNAIFRLLERWIKDNPEEWNQIKEIYQPDVIEDKELDYIFWCNIFHWNDPFVMWMHENKDNWKNIKSQWDEPKMIEQASGDWLKKHHKLWRIWEKEIEGQIEEWINAILKKKELEKTSNLLAKKDEKKDFFCQEKECLGLECPRIKECLNSLDDLALDFDFNQDPYDSFELDDFSVMDNTPYCSKWISNPKINNDDLLPERHDIEMKAFNLCIKRHKSTWNKWYYRYCYSKFYHHSTNIEEHLACFDFWKSLHPGKWKRWKNKNYAIYKQKVQYISLWIKYLKQVDAEKFDNWAHFHSKEWREAKMLICNSMEYKYRKEYKFCTGNNMDRKQFNKWKYEHPEEWAQWKEYLDDKITITYWNCDHDEKIEAF